MIQTASTLSKDTQFRVVALEATAVALKVLAVEDDDHDWIDLLSMQHTARSCIRAQLRLHSAANAKEDWPPPKPRLMEFERLFLKSLSEKMRQQRAASWPNACFQFVGNLQVRTSPGMPLYGERVEVGCSWGGTAVADQIEQPLPVRFPTHEDDSQ